MIKIKFNIIATLSLLFIYSCTNSVDTNYNGLFDTANMSDAKALISLANDWHFTYPKIDSYITPKEVIVNFPDGRNTTKSIPDSLFYIAIAPYINYTHTCSTHYTSSCKGELTETDLVLNIQSNNNFIIKNKSIKTLKNGFFELWLERNKIYKIQISQNNKSGEEIITTGNNDRTCITTIILK